MERLQAASETVQRTLTGIGEGAFGALQGGLDRIATSFQELDARVESFGGLVETAMGVAGLSVEELIGKVNSLGRAFSEAAQASTRMGNMGGMGGGGIDNTGGGNGDGGRNGGGNRDRLPPPRPPRPPPPPDDEEEGDGVTPFGTREEWLNAQRENRDRDAAYRDHRRQAEYENREQDAARARTRAEADEENRAYDARERERARQSRPDVNFEDTLGAGGAGYVGGRAGRRGGGGGHSGVGGIVKGMGHIAAAGGFYESEKIAMQEDQDLTMTLQEMGFSVTSPEFPALMAKLRGTVREGTEGTIYSEAKGAHVMPGTAGQLGAVFATPQERMQAYQTALPSSLKFAEVSEMYHRGSLDESLKAALSYEHMTGRYEGKPLKEGLNHLLGLSLATGDTIAEEQNTLKYSVPIGRAAGMNPDDTAALTGFFQIMGFSGSTAGTGLGQMIMGLTQTGGPLAAQLGKNNHQLEHEFSHALHLDPKALHEVHQSRGNQHVAAMQALGLFNEKGQVAQDVAPGGRFNKDAFVEHIEHYLTSHTPMEGLGTLRNAFTVRGSRQAAELNDPATVEKLHVFLENMKHPPDVEKLQGELATRPLQQFEQALANLSNISNTLATTTLGGLNTVLGTTNTLLSGFNHLLQASPTAATIGGYALETGMAATALGLSGPIRRGVTSVLRGGAPAAAEGGLSMGFGGAEAAGAAAAAGGTPFVGPALLLYMLSRGGYEAGSAAANNLPDDVSGRSAAVAGLNYRATHGGLPAWSAPAAAPTAAPGPTTATAPATGTAQPGPVHIGPVNLSAPAHEDKESWVHEVGTKFTEWLRNSMATNSGDGHGSNASVFVGGSP